MHDSTALVPRHRGTYAGAEPEPEPRTFTRADVTRRTDPRLVALADERRAARDNLRPLNPRVRASLYGVRNHGHESGRVRASGTGRGDVFWNVVLAGGLGSVCLAGLATSLSVIWLGA